MLQRGGNDVMVTVHNLEEYIKVIWRIERKGESLLEKCLILAFPHIVLAGKDSFIHCVVPFLEVF